MFDAKSNAAIKKLNVRTEIHGDEAVPAIDIRLILEAVPVDRITSACPNVDRFYDGDQVAIGEVNPLVVGHKLENLDVTISRRKLKACDIKRGMKVQLLPGKLAKLDLLVQTQHHDDLALFVMGLLQDEATVHIVENQRRIDEVEQ